MHEIKKRGQQNVRNQTEKSYKFIQTFIEINGNLKTLMKKIIYNTIICQAWGKFLNYAGVITEDKLVETSYLSDLLLLEVLDQIWIQEVYEPFS